MRIIYIIEAGADIYEYSTVYVGLDKKKALEAEKLLKEKYGYVSLEEYNDGYDLYNIMK